KRGLPNLRTTVDALPTLTSPETLAMFEKYGVLSRGELESRETIYLEQYVKTVATEARLTIEIAKTMILPAAVRYQGELAQTAASVKAAGLTPDLELLQTVSDLTKGLKESIAVLEKKMGHNGAGSVAGSVLEEAKHFWHDVVPAMQEVRRYADELEGVVADDLWPLPTYQEMLFIK